MNQIVSEMYSYCTCFGCVVQPLTCQAARDLLEDILPQSFLPGSKIMYISKFKEKKWFLVQKKYNQSKSK